MKLPVGSVERDIMKRQIEHQIAEAADKWEMARARAAATGGKYDDDGKEIKHFYNVTRELARLVRKWRRF